MGGTTRILAALGCTVLLLGDAPRGRAEEPAPAALRFGSGVAFVGDVDGDGVPDVAVAAYASTNARGYASGGRGAVFSGKDGARLYSLPVVPGDPAAVAPDFGEGVPRVAAAGDVDRDGVPDVLLGVPLASPGGARYAGEVLVCSGKDGRAIRTLKGPHEGAQFGEAVAGGVDVDGDGIPDLLVGSPGARKAGGPGPADEEGNGRVQLFSGKDGKALVSVDGPVPGSTFGASVAFPGDLDGDGVPDLASGLPEAGEAGVVWAGSGKDGHTLFGVPGRPNPAPSGKEGDDDPPGPPMFGWCVAAAGDWDRDGRPDLAVGAIYAMPSGRRSEGQVQILSGRDRSVLASLVPPAAVEPGLCGYSVAAVGDLDRDGRPEIAAGLPLSGPHGEGRVLVFSGKDGSVLRVLKAPAGGERFGQSVAGGGDVDGDGVPDVAVGQPGWPRTMPGPGRAFVLSGKDGSVLRTLPADGR